jgi:cobalt-zinc-cadmium resistance protein CzcA
MIERVLSFSIQHRKLVVFFTALLGAFGLYALSRLPIDAVPDITNNQVQINTPAAALSPTDIERRVTLPIETALAGIPGLEYTRSLSRNGFSQVTAVFADSVDIYFARNQVTERLAEARESLPDGVEPKMGAISTGLGEVYMWSVAFAHPAGKGAKLEDGKPGWQADGTYLAPEGERLTTEIERAAYLRTVQDWIIRPQLKQVKNIAGVDAIGGYVKQYQVQPDPALLVSYGIGFTELIEALERNNLALGAGYVERKGEAFSVRATGQIENPKEISEIVIGSRGGTPIHVRDVAKVLVGKELRTGSASENGEEVVVGTALMLIGANSRTVAAAVDEKMVEIRKSLPPDIEAKTVLNRTKLVDATISTVQTSLIEGAILVIVVLFLMLGNFRAALIAALAIPLSMLIAAIGMVESKVSGNLMSLGAIDFGLIVDGAVIIVENCLRKLAERQHHLGRELTLSERLHEVLVATREMAQPSVFGQAIIITVYIPILTLSGVEGKMFTPMAMTVIFALVAAFVLSLTFVPAMVALLVKGKVSEKESFIVAKSRGAYAPLLDKALLRPKAVVAGASVVFALSAGLFFLLGQEFLPTLDEKDIAMHAMRIPSTSIEQSSDMQFDVEKTVAAIPEVRLVFSKTGTAEMASDPMPPNVSDTFIILRPREEWPDSGKPKAQVIADIEAAVGKVPGNNYEFTQPIQMRFNELIAGVRSDVAVKVYGDDFEAMGRSAEAIAAALRGVKGSADVKVEQTEGLPTLTIAIDRAAAGRYGLSVADIHDVVAAAIGGREAGHIFEGDRRFDIVVRLPDELRRDLDQLANLPIPLKSEEGQEGVQLAVARTASFVPLSSVARLEMSEGPNQISRENGKRRIVVQVNVRGRDLGSFVAEAQEKVGAVALPPGGWLDWGGQFENLVGATKRLMIVVPLCFLMIFLLLFSTFNSVRHALLVFSGVPLGLTGGVVALALAGLPLSISAAVGFIALSGIAVLNSLVMVSYINQLRLHGAELTEAIKQGALTRLRPILMTALVASLGFVPMALASGTGAEVQKPLAIVVIGGLISSTLLTLFVLPCLYWLFAREDEEGAPT